MVQVSLLIYLSLGVSAASWRLSRQVTAIFFARFSEMVCHCLFPRPGREGLAQGHHVQGGLPISSLTTNQLFLELF